MHMHMLAEAWPDRKDKVCSKATQAKLEEVRSRRGQGRNPAGGREHSARSLSGILRDRLSALPAAYLEHWRQRNQRTTLLYSSP
jgi:hypothetical protein